MIAVVIVVLAFTWVAQFVLSAMQAKAEVGRRFHSRTKSETFSSNSPKTPISADHPQNLLQDGAYQDRGLHAARQDLLAADDHGGDGGRPGTEKTEQNTERNHTREGRVKPTPANPKSTTKKALMTDSLFAPCPLGIFHCLCRKERQQSCPN